VFDQIRFYRFLSVIIDGVVLSVAVMAAPQLFTRVGEVADQILQSSVSGFYKPSRKVTICG
jgi:hypothetical protein